jgi:ABC-type lipoprotein release transport system permease subunit
MLVRLGWRNLWRNTRRSLITVAGLGFAFGFLIVLIGFSRGLSLQLLRNGTELMVGHIQVHDAQYLPDRVLYNTIGGRDGTDWRALIARLRQHRAVRQAAPRVYTFGLLSTGARSAGGQLVGVDPAAEQGLNRLFAPDIVASLSSPHAIAIGERLALDIGATVGDEVAVIAPASDGTQGNELFHLTAIVRTGLPALDRSIALTRLDDAQSLLALDPDRIHEIAVAVGDPLDAAGVAAELARTAGLPAHTVVQGWRELLPQLSTYIDFVRAINAFIIGLIVLFSSMGVLNTMAMATFERVHEFGMLNAIGMKPSAIIASVLLESLFLVSLGLAGGLGFGVVLMAYLTTRGLNLTWLTGELAMFQSRLDPVVKGVWDWQTIPWAALCLAVATVAAAYWPSRRATRVDPVEALQAPVMR